MRRLIKNSLEYVKRLHSSGRFKLLSKTTFPHMMNRFNICMQNAADTYEYRSPLFSNNLKTERGNFKANERYFKANFDEYVYDPIINFKLPAFLPNKHKSYISLADIYENSFEKYFPENNNVNEHKYFKMRNMFKLYRTIPVSIFVNRLSTQFLQDPLCFKITINKTDKDCKYDTLNALNKMDVFGIGLLKFPYIYYENDKEVAHIDLYIEAIFYTYGREEFRIGITDTFYQESSEALDHIQRVENYLSELQSSYWYGPTKGIELAATFDKSLGIYTVPMHLSPLLIDIIDTECLFKININHKTHSSPWDSYMVDNVNVYMLQILLAKRYLRPFLFRDSTIPYFDIDFTFDGAVKPFNTIFPTIVEARQNRGAGHILRSNKFKNVDKANLLQN